MNFDYTSFTIGYVSATIVCAIINRYFHNKLMKSLSIELGYLKETWKNKN